MNPNCVERTPSPVCHTTSLLHCSATFFGCTALPSAEHSAHVDCGLRLWNDHEHFGCQRANTQPTAGEFLQPHPFDPGNESMGNGYPAVGNRDLTTWQSRSETNFSPEHVSNCSKAFDAVIRNMTIDTTGSGHERQRPAACVRPIQTQALHGISVREPVEVGRCCKSRPRGAHPGFAD